MTDAYIFDAVRTPRGKGKKDGSLHEVTSLALSAGVLNALKDRTGLDTSQGWNQSIWRPTRSGAALGTSMWPVALR